MLAEKFTYDHDLARRLPLTCHAIDRSIERQISTQQIHLVFFHGDLRLPAKDGCSEHQISHQAAMRLRRQGIGPRNIGLLTSLVVIVAESGSIVTVFHR